MIKVKIVKTKEENFYIKGRRLPKGCKLCLKGQKTVLFLNGICQRPNHCSWYCPISEERKNKELTFANEIKINSQKGLLEEVNKVDAKGMSITGGEPLSELNLVKTLDYIQYIKSQKGDKFHIHLYTNGINFDKNIAKKLVSAGLDEIRFHPDKENWAVIEDALDTGLIIGAEVPVIPNRENLNDLRELIIYLDKIEVDFINLNEFEYCFPNSEFLKERGFYLQKGSIASVINSQQAALDLMKNLAKNVSLQIHFCSTTAKDYYQLKNRYLRRAKNIKLPYEVITEEGLLIFAQIEGRKENLENFYHLILSEMKIDEKLVVYNGDNIKVPFYISVDTQFVSIFESFQLIGYIVEMTPFRDLQHQQITEKTPINLFKKEFGFNENRKRKFKRY
ncbi:MAG: radical SAM protein [Promethearchaeota archaeon]